MPFLVTTWAYSNAPFASGELQLERTEAILAGMVAALEFFGCIPKEVWWDNPKTVATLILLGRQRQIHPRYAANHRGFTTPSIPSSACPPGAMRSLMPSRPSRPCNAGSPRGSRERLTSTSSIRLFASTVRPNGRANCSVALRTIQDGLMASPKNKLRHRMFPICALMLV